MDSAQQRAGCGIGRACGEAANTCCAGCGAPFACGALAGSKRCSCMELPPLPDPAAGSGCYCPACLTQRTAADQPPPR